MAGNPPAIVIQSEAKDLGNTKKTINYQLSTNKTMEKKDLWSKILHIVITVLTAIATTFGVTSCI